MIVLLLEVARILVLELGRALIAELKSHLRRAHDKVKKRKKTPRRHHP